MKQAGAFSRPFAVDRLAGGGTVVASVRAEAAAERAAIAARLQIPAVEALAVEWTLRGSPGGVVEAAGVLDAVVVQLCVVTLEPFAAPVRERFSVLFVPEDATAAGGFDDDPDTPDAIGYEGGTIDLGEAAAEQLALALDPFPRAPGAVFAPLETEREGEGEWQSPFAVLAQRRRDPPGEAS